MKKVVKLGTRRSLLALAQSQWVAHCLEEKFREIKVELVGIDTRGDQILDVPLQKVEGKDFFVAELDNALLSGRVDMTVHSMKDLSLDRPDGITLAATPKREDPRDVLLLGPQCEGKLKTGNVCFVGTSSPRRLENLPEFLTRALPKLNKKPPKLDFKEIRGNVNTRIKKVISGEIDAVVLALAGLARLYFDPNGRAELEKLLIGFRWMILPLAECPTAPAQGALAVECRKNDSDLLNKIRKLHDPSTELAVKTERAILAEWGGGCHQRLGATQIDHPEIGRLLFIKGRMPSGEAVSELKWNKPTLKIKASATAVWDSSKWRKERVETIPMELNKTEVETLSRAEAIFIAHHRAFTGLNRENFSSRARIWTSGTSSWFKLAEQGIWIEGCAEGFGYDFIQNLLSISVLKLPSFKDWTILTHKGARDSWGNPNVFTPYEVATSDVKPSKSPDLSGKTHLFWGSGSLYDRFGHLADKQACHACGPGKTARHLKKKGVKNLQVFPSNQEWRKWLKFNSED